MLSHNLFTSKSGIVTTSATATTDIVPKILHLIWHGSELRDIHVQRIIRWKEINPDYAVKVFVDEVHQAAIQAQLQLSGVEVIAFDLQSLPSTIQAIVREFTKPRIVGTPNYGAISDFTRFYILKEGGWYVDTDIEPVQLKDYKIDPELKFLINAKRINDVIDDLSPSAFAVSKNHPLVMNAIRVLEAFSKMLSNDMYSAIICSSIGSLRLYGTQLSTGFLLLGALGLTTVKDQPIVDIDPDDDDTIPDTDLFDRVSVRFKEYYEKSYLYSKNESNANGTRHASLLPGLVLDANYNSAQKTYFSYPIFREFIERRDDTYKRLASVKFELLTQSAANELRTTSTLNPNRLFTISDAEIRDQMSALQLNNSPTVTPSRSKSALGEGT